MIMNAYVDPLPPEPAPMVVELIELPKPEPLSPAPAPTPAPPQPTPAAKPTPEPPKPAKAPPKHQVARKAKTPPPNVETIAANDGPSGDGDNEISDGALASAATAGSGAGSAGGQCDMVGHLQARLRRDRQVQSAMAVANRGRAIRVWNGRWVRHPGQEGAGLAAVREAIMWEVAFAPDACKQRPVSGMVLISLNDAPGAARVVLGSGQWRWSDLLFARGELSSGESLRP